MKGCYYGAGGCAVLGLIAYAGADDETFRNAYGGENKSDATGKYFAGMALWCGIFGGAGYLIGSAFDDWELIYMSTSKQSESTGKANLEIYEDITPALVMGKHLR